MCDELGALEHMQAYVEEAGGTSLCDVISRKGCSEKAGGFIDKWVSKSATERESEHVRLSAMDMKSVKAETRAWVAQRKSLMGQLVKRGAEL